jgi:hypothetical protein
MSFWKWVSTLIQRRKLERNDQEMPISMVLLLRTTHLFRKDELISAAERAWHRSFSGGDGSMHFVTQSGHVTIVKVGAFILNIANSSGPYLDNPENTAKSLPQESQRKAWSQHRAWTAIDCWNLDADVELQHCVLAKLAAELLDDNCVGIYIPDQSSFVPNGSFLYGELTRIAASRDFEVG